jgi:hypothetical protein
MAATQARTGRWGNATVNSVVLNITGWTGKPAKQFATGTDSGNYDTVTKQLFTAQYPGETNLSGSLKGNYDFGGSTDANFTQLFLSDGPYALILGFSPTVLFATMLADFTDIEYTVSLQGATMLEWSANYLSNGKPTYA